jgi:hypothetical protein
LLAAAGRVAGNASQKLDETPGQRAIRNTRKEAGTSGKAARIFSELGAHRDLPGREILPEHEVILPGRQAMSALPCPQLLSTHI